MEILTTGTQAVLKALLSESKGWSLRELAQVSGLSLGSVSHAMHVVSRMGLLRRDSQNRIIVVSPQRIEQLLLSVTDLRASVDTALFLPLRPQAIANEIEKASRQASLPYAITGPLGLWLHYKHVPPTDAYVYIAKADRNPWRISLKRVGAVRASPFNANLFLIETSDPHVLRNAVRVGSLSVAPIVQVYLDCTSMGGRFAEGAKELWSRTSESSRETPSK